MVENLAQHSLVALRVICDHVRSVGGVLNIASFPRSCCYLQQVKDRDTMLSLMRKKREKEEVAT